MVLVWACSHTANANATSLCRTMLKIRSTPTEGKRTGQVREWMIESRKSESNIPAIPNTIRNSVHENSQENAPSDPVQLTLPRLDLPRAAFH